MPPRCWLRRSTPSPTRATRCCCSSAVGAPSGAATAEHPFGYGRERYIFGFIVSVVLFSVGGLFALYEAYHKWHEIQEGHPDELLESRWWWVPMVILVAAIVAESFSFRTAIRESNKTRGKQRWSKYIRAAKAPELPVILLEDFAALVGLAFALFGVGMTLLTHNGIFDVIGTAMIGLLLVAVAITLAIETKSLLLGEAASPDAVRPDRASTDRDPWRRADHPHEDPPPRSGGGAGRGQDRGRAGDTAVEVADTIDRAEVNIREAEPMVTALYLEPDIYDPNYVPAPRPERPAAPSH